MRMTTERDPKVRDVTGGVDPAPRASVSHSGVVIPEEQMSASRSVLLAEVPSRLLDRLLVLSTELPVAQGEDAVVQALVDGLAALFPGHAVGATVVTGGAAKTYRCSELPAPSEGKRESGAFFPSSMHRSEEAIFSQFPIERVVRVPGIEGLAIHVAADDPSLAEEASTPFQVAHRAVYVLEAARRHARTDEELAQLRRDIDERDAMIVQAEKLASLGQLAAGMVHEINNPLTSILAYTDYLSKRASSRNDDEDLERVRRINESARRMLRLSRELVSYARPSSNPPHPVVISGVIEQAIVFCEHLLSDSDIVIVRQFGDGVLPVRGRPDQLAQVFVNLITNACHAMPKKDARLVIATELVAEDTRVRVVVTDNGHGIPDDIRNRVFLPFFTTKDEGQGTGLGLSIVKSIVEAHGGEIGVDSGPEGTSFFVLLPVASEA